MWPNRRLRSRSSTPSQPFAIDTRQKKVAAPATTENTTATAAQIIRLRARYSLPPMELIRCTRMFGRSNGLSSSTESTVTRMTCGVRKLKTTARTVPIADAAIHPHAPCMACAMNPVRLSCLLCAGCFF